MLAAYYDKLRTVRGVMRSLRIYYADRSRHRAMEALYRQFVKPGDLVFDVGAHVGDRVAAFRRLGARVIAVEPQPALARTLRLIYGRDSAVAVEEVGVGRDTGKLELKLNLDNPTVSTASADFIAAAQGAAGWQGQQWAHPVEVELTTLDALIARHGMPSFIKLDVEGFEAEALEGLTCAPVALSFEFTTIQREVAAAAIARCTVLGFRRFNAVIGESHAFAHADWLAAEPIAGWIEALPHAANSGDVYAALR